MRLRAGDKTAGPVPPRHGIDSICTNFKGAEARTLQT
jgi:hypothetical protein